MSEVIQKYRDKAERLSEVIESYKTLATAILTHIKGLVKGNPELEKAMDALAQRIKGADNLFQVQQLHRDYMTLVKYVDSWMKDRWGAAKGGGGGGLFSAIGSLFGGKEEAEQKVEAAAAKEYDTRMEIVDTSRELLGPYVSLLDSFAKGTLILADEEEPFYTPLKFKRDKRFAELKQPEVDSMSASLYNFYINKSNESHALENEREELKRIISNLTSHIQTLSVSSETFGNKLDTYSRKIAVTTNLDEIKQIQRAILTETLTIQKENGAVRERLVESERKLKESAEKIAKLENALEMARQEKIVDHLTQLYNRGYFDEKLKETVTNYQRYKEPFCLIMYDVDHFKKFNDAYGHQVGDKVLRTVADISKDTVRAADTVARYGGEEFAVIVYKTSSEQGAKVAESLRAAVGSHEFVFKGGDKTISVNVSLGVAEFAEGDTPESLIQRADKRLYDAKKQGRNRVVAS
ncbi:MAG: diguanylate cyclase [Nitrospinae bacterium]|nr:diguanylate cyclase [Nitrospinota bacterium]